MRSFDLLVAPSANDFGKTVIEALKRKKAA
jgi:hypothetical protein